MALSRSSSPSCRAAHAGSSRGARDADGEGSSPDRRGALARPLPWRFGWRELGFSTQLMVTMVALVLVTAAAVGLLTYRTVSAAIAPQELDRLQGRVRLLAAQIDAEVTDAEVDVLALRGAAAVDGIMRATLAGGTDPATGLAAAVWRDQLARLFAAILAADPIYLQIRYIGVADDGREIVRVDRLGPGGAIRVVPEAELQSKADQPYFAQAMRLAPGRTYLSPVELNQEHGVIEVPHVPVLRAATPVYSPDERPFGALIFGLDMRLAFARVRAMAPPGGEVYLVGRHGDYFGHPDASPERDVEPAPPARLQDQFPELAGALEAHRDTAQLARDRAGQRYGVALVWVRTTEHVGVAATLPHAILAASTASIRQSSLIVGVAAALCAMVLAALVARSLTRPLARMATAVNEFRGDAAIAMPTAAGGEIGALARAFTAMASDIRERTAALQRSNAELEQFASVASHDLREPLRTVASYTALLAERYRGQLDERADKYINYVVDGTERMQQLVDDLLRYARVGTQGKPLEPTDAGAVARRVIRGLAATIEDSGAEIACGALPTVLADESQLRQLLQNLISNAIKFRAPDRAPRVRIDALAKDGVQIFAVEDNGIGIEPQHAGRIFQMFERLHPQREYQGNGIGLAIAKKIVERHGGRIWFASEPERGTTFYFSLRAAGGDEPG